MYYAGIILKLIEMTRKYTFRGKVGCRLLYINAYFCKKKYKISDITSVTFYIFINLRFFLFGYILRLIKISPVIKE